MIRKIMASAVLAVGLASIGAGVAQADLCPPSPPVQPGVCNNPSAPPLPTPPTQPGVGPGPASPR